MSGIELVPAVVVEQINSGGIAVMPFKGDTNFSGGTARSITSAVDRSGVLLPAPASVYQSERYGNHSPFSYTFTGLTPNTFYTLRLHFAETYFSAPGRRSFNVSINGNPVLTNFDPGASAGGVLKAVIREFTASADSSGTITVQYSVGSANNPQSSAIELYSAH